MMRVVFFLSKFGEREREGERDEKPLLLFAAWKKSCSLRQRRAPSSSLLLLLLLLLLLVEEKWYKSRTEREKTTYFALSLLDLNLVSGQPPRAHPDPTRHPHPGARASGSAGCPEDGHRSRQSLSAERAGRTPKLSVAVGCCRGSPRRHRRRRRRRRRKQHLHEQRRVQLRRQLGLPRRQRRLRGRFVHSRPLPPRTRRRPRRGQPRKRQLGKGPQKERTETEASTGLTRAS